MIDLADCKPYEFKLGCRIKFSKTEYVVKDRRIVVCKQGWKRKEYLCKCIKCGAEIWKGEPYLKNCIRGTTKINGCGVCTNKIVVTGINDVATTHPHIVHFFKNPEEAKHINAASREKRVFICPFCGFEKKTCVEYIVSKNRLSCNRCSDNISYPNKFALSVLTQLKVENLEVEYAPKWANGYRYDFSFWYKGIHYLLEMDGGFHFRGRFGRTDKEVKDRDLLKNKYAETNGCLLIRINCEKSDIDYIKNNMLESVLSKIFDFSIVNWEKVKKDCTNNLLYDICTYYNTHKNASLKELSTYFSVCSHTIRAYLKRGGSIGIIDYNTLLEEQEIKMYDAINMKKEHPEYTNVQIGKLLGKSPSTISNYLKRAKTLGLIEDLKLSSDVIKKNLIEFIRNHKNDSIYDIVRLTGHSKEFVKKCMKEVGYA